MTIYTDTRLVPLELRERAAREGLARDHIGWAYSHRTDRVVAQSTSGRWWWCPDPDGRASVSEVRWDMPSEAVALTRYLDWVEGHHSAHIDAWRWWARVAPLFDALLEIDPVDAEWLIERYRAQIGSVLHVDLSNSKPLIVLQADTEGFEQAVSRAQTALSRISVRRGLRHSRHRWGPAREGGVRVCERCGRVRFSGALVGLSPRVRYAASLEAIGDVAASRREAGPCFEEAP